MEKVERDISLSVRVAVYLFSILLTVATFLALTYYASIAKERIWTFAEATKAKAISWAWSVLPEPEMRVKVLPAPNLDSVLKIVSSEYDIPLFVLQAIADKESSYGRNLYAFEPDTFIRRTSADRSLSENERRMMSSSHGVLHVMGYVAQQSCHLSWPSLYNTLLGVRCGAKILRDNLNSVRQLPTAEARLRSALKLYNSGSLEGKNGIDYTNDVMARMVKFINKEALKGI